MEAGPVGPGTVPQSLDETAYCKPGREAVGGGVTVTRPQVGARHGDDLGCRLGA